MDKLKLLVTVNGNETYNELLIKNFYNMMILKYGYTPGGFRDPAIDLFINDLYDGFSEFNDKLSEYNAKKIKKFYAELYIDYIEKEIPMNQICGNIHIPFMKILTRLFTDNHHIILNESVIRHSIELMANYHPLTKITYSNLELCLKDATIYYKKCELEDKNTANLMKILEEQIGFNKSFIKNRNQYEYHIYKYMIQVNYKQTKDKLLNEFVKGSICRNDELVTLFYDLYKDEYEVEFDKPLYHGIKPKYYDTKFDVERTYKEYSGYTSFSKSKEVAINFANNEDVIGWVLESKGKIKGLDIEKMITDSKYLNIDYMLDNCISEEEVLVRHPENVIIHKINEHKIENGMTEFNSTEIDLINNDNNAKCYKRVIDKMYENNIYIDAKQIKIFNYSAIKSEESLNFICELVKKDQGNTVYLINGFNELIHIKKLKDKGFRILNEEFNDSIIENIMLYGYLIHERQISLFNIDCERYDKAM